VEKNVDSYHKRKRHAKATYSARKSVRLSFISCLFLLFFQFLFGDNEDMTFTLTSSSFIHEGEIPSKYTCEGLDISPPLSWKNPPEGTVSYVLIVDDPDAPDPKAPKLTWVHWVLFNIPKDCLSLKEDIQSNELPKGTLGGYNNWGKTGYGGPYPPIGRHRYYFKLYALNKKLANLNNPTKNDIEKAMENAILEKAVLMGTYEKRGLLST
jgi:Raf kinase inhibitor-like YbhB/YbcL family protein